MKRLVAASVLCIFGGLASADEFTQADVDRWMQQFEQVAQEGR